MASVSSLTGSTNVPSEIYKKSASHVISFKPKLKKATATLSFTFWDKPSAPCSTHYWCITGDGWQPGPQRVTKKILQFLESPV